MVHGSRPGLAGRGASPPRAAPAGGLPRQRGAGLSSHSPRDPAAGWAEPRRAPRAAAAPVPDAPLRPAPPPAGLPAMPPHVRTGPLRIPKTSAAHALAHSDSNRSSTLDTPKQMGDMPATPRSPTSPSGRGRRTPRWGTSVRRGPSGKQACGRALCAVLLVVAGRRCCCCAAHQQLRLCLQQRLGWARSPSAPASPLQRPSQPPRAPPLAPFPCCCRSPKIDGMDYWDYCELLRSSSL